MGKYFGTDGVRGVANRELTPELAFKLGRCGGYILTKGLEHPKVLIGRDTRLSCDLLENALSSGLLSIGVEVLRLGVISTPGVAYLTRCVGAAAGVMISASHNSFEDNGIKFFGADGFKLNDATEAEIEALLEEETDNLHRPTGAAVGKVGNYFEGKQKYLSYLKTTLSSSLSGLHIAIDCANGSASSIAPHLLADLEADISTLGTSPNGENINDGVGSTHPEGLQKFVREHEADVGLAFDGDADRLIAVDEQGNIVNGDQIMYICAKAMQNKGTLKENTVVSTVMSNLGFYKALEAEGIKVETTQVGDRYVLENMRRGGYNLGGEQSGHIIFLDYNSTGDGLLSALQLLNVMKESGQKLSELTQDLHIYPQHMVNVKVSDKNGVLQNVRVRAVIEEVEQQMNGRGRVLVRPSGTEPLVRIMAEAEDEELLKGWVERIAQVVREEMGLDG
jgi:phosphoglucosamine mutase